MTAIDELWDSYKETNDVAKRDQLIQLYLPLVRRVAGQVASGLPQAVDVGDLESYGTFGLIDAIQKFQPERGFKFETYAVNRIKGSILDEMRKVDWVPRSVRAKAKAVERTTSRLEGELKRHPTNEEIAEALDWPVGDVVSVLASSSSNHVVSLDNESTGRDSESRTESLGNLIPDKEEQKPFEYDAVVNGIMQSIETMSDKERIVLTLFYYEGLSLNDIGIVLGVTESRVCQILTKTVEHGRQSLDGLISI